MAQKLLITPPRESEHKICDLFADASRGQKLYGFDGTLYIIVFAEIDVVRKRRFGHVDSLRNNVEKMFLLNYLRK